MSLSTFEESWEDHDETTFIEIVSKAYRRSFPDYVIRKNFRLQHGTVDLLLASPDKRVTLIECKIGGGINDIAHALGQLLAYQTQFRERPVCQIVCRDRIDPDTKYFAERLCADHGIQLVSSSVFQFLEECEHDADPAPDPRETF